jgi:hypothetical protein
MHVTITNIKSMLIQPVSSPSKKLLYQFISRKYSCQRLLTPSDAQNNPGDPGSRQRSEATKKGAQSIVRPFLLEHNAAKI